MIDFKILLVENDKAFATSMGAALAVSFDVESAHTGAEALKTIETFKPQLVLIDYQIEDMNCIELQQTINKEYDDIHVVMMSNIDRSLISLQSLKRRAMDYIFKSDDENRFLNDVCKLVRYIIEVKKRQETEQIMASGYYAIVKRLHDEKKWTVEDLEEALKRFEEE